MTEHLLHRTSITLAMAVRAHVVFYYNSSLAHIKGTAEVIHKQKMENAQPLSSEGDVKVKVSMFLQLPSSRVLVYPSVPSNFSFLLGAVRQV